MKSAFARGKSILVFVFPHSDILAAELTLQLGQRNDGINVNVDAIHFQMTAGSVVLPIDLPLNKFSQLKDGSLVFSGSTNGLPATLAVKPLGGSRYAVVVGVAQASLGGFINPAAINLSLGADTGQVKTNALVLKK